MDRRTGGRDIKCTAAERRLIHRVRAPRVHPRLAELEVLQWTQDATLSPGGVQFWVPVYEEGWNAQKDVSQAWRLPRCPLGGPAGRPRLHCASSIVSWPRLRSLRSARTRLSGSTVHVPTCRWPHTHTHFDRDTYALAPVALALSLFWSMSFFRRWERPEIGAVLAPCRNNTVRSLVGLCQTGRTGSSPVDDARTHSVPPRSSAAVEPGTAILRTFSLGTRRDSTSSNFRLALVAVSRRGCRNHRCKSTASERQARGGSVEWHRSPGSSGAAHGPCRLRVAN